MLWLPVGHGSSRYYLCLRCATIREDVHRADGVVIVTHFHHLETGNLPAKLVERVRDILAQPHYRQLPLFGD
jgi:hypothetical protein